MSTSDSIPPPDDRVARAIDALRRAPVPDGPSPETIARTLAAVRTTAERPGLIPPPRRRIMFTILKMAAAVLAAAAGVTYFAGFPPRSATAEFVEAARKIQDARTLSFRQTATVASVPVPINVRVLYKVPGLVRNETEMEGAGVSIMDLIHGKALMLTPADKSAMLTDLPTAKGDDPARPRDPSAAMIEYMRQLAQKDGEPAGEKVIGDVRARGFRVKDLGMDMTVWVDPGKKLPMLIEYSGRFGNLDTRGTITDIRLDPELDDALFRLEPPAGYAVRKLNAKLDMTIEEAVARYLRELTDATGGRFPARLDDLAEFVKAAAAKRKAQPEEPKAKAAEGTAQTRELEQKAMEFAAAVAQVMAFCQQKKDQYGYKPDGVKLGDAKAIIFWYKPEGRDKYKAVYGDLHIGEARAEELPAKP
jgi:outer membrane lipoprotein-sorting protein